MVHRFIIIPSSAERAKVTQGRWKAVFVVSQTLRLNLVFLLPRPVLRV